MSNFYFRTDIATPGHNCHKQQKLKKGKVNLLSYCYTRVPQTFRERLSYEKTELRENRIFRSDKPFGMVPSPLAGGGICLGQVRLNISVVT